ncbi:MAG: CBS domain-containing protein [Pseudomonadales bacterium]|nr:CBS domain-containing protein [Pseudomonadales bacterium]
MTERSALVEDYMTRRVVSFEVRDDVADIASTLLENRILGAPVLDKDGNVVGFVSEQDCIKEMLNTAWHCELTATAADIMHAEVLTVDPKMDISDLAQQLTPDKPKMYPVVSEGKLRGVITRSDILQALVDKSAACHHPTTKATARG